MAKATTQHWSFLYDGFKSLLCHTERVCVGASRMGYYYCIAKIKIEISISLPLFIFLIFVLLLIHQLSLFSSSFDTFTFRIFLQESFAATLTQNFPQFSKIIFFDCNNIGNCYLMLDIKNFTHGSIYSKCSCFSFSTKYKISSICVKKNNSS